MDLDEQTIKAVLIRLRRVRGQVDGIITMIESGRSCRDVVTQLAAASKALDRAGFSIMANTLRTCLLAEEGTTELNADELERLFLFLA
jgi:DNA-binding FrmR family transcriptional regulator